MDRAALVTGGSSGIGLAIATMLREEGFALTLAARTRAKVEAAAASLNAQAVTADVAREDDCRRLVDEHRETHGRLDLLVNSAGVGIAGRVLQAGAAMRQHRVPRFVAVDHEADAHAVAFQRQHLGVVPADERAERGGLHRAGIPPS